MAPTEGRVVKPEWQWDCRHGTLMVLPSMDNGVIVECELGSVSENFTLVQRESL